jgi:DNA-binding CsgD family transcriptional regulator
MAFQFIKGISAACAFFIFCFRLNNVERLFGMSLIIFYYGFYYTIWRYFPIVQSIGKKWGSEIAVAAYFAVVFLCKDRVNEKKKKNQIEQSDQKEGAGVKFVIVLHMVYYTIMCTINYLEWMEGSISSMPYGLGQFAAILFILLIQVHVSQSALYIWLSFLVMSLLGLGILVFDSGATQFTASFVYGLGDGLGYIIIYYLCAGVIQKAKSFKMCKLICLILFTEYCLISGVYSRVMGAYEGPKHYLAFGVVLVLCSVCFMLIPLMQKKLYKADWTDGIQLQEITEYTQSLAEIKTINIRNDLDLTEREQEIFTLLLKGMSPKDISYTLKVSYHTIVFHRTNLYRKLGVQSIQELFVKYGSGSTAS